MSILECLFMVMAIFGICLVSAIVLTGTLMALHAIFRLRRMKRYKAQDIADGLHRLESIQKSK